MARSATDLSWPAGQGEIAERMRRHAWERTPLGPTDTWPRSLAYAVELMLDAGQPIAIWWGQKLVQLYNDAYREYFDPQDRSLLGASAHEEPAPNWAVIGPEIERVMAGGPVSMKDDAAVSVFRFGRREDAWWTCAFNPIRPEAPDGVGGVLVACNDVTVAHNHREVLRKSSHELEQLVRALSQATWETNAEGFVVNAHPDWSAYTGRLRSNRLDMAGSM
jgi:PAS domain-containing protein